MRPHDDYVVVPDEFLGVPVHNPSHPSFATSAVMIPLPAAPRDLSLGASSTDASQLQNSFPVPPLSDQLQASEEDCHVGNGEECSFENGEECILENGESRDSCSLGNGESPDPAGVSIDPVADSIDLVPVRRPVHQWLYYAPAASDPVLEHAAPSRAKRQSKPPQRLTSSELGKMVSGTKKVALLAFSEISLSTNEKGSHSLSDGSIAGESTNRPSGFLEICAMSSDKQEAAESSAGSGSETNENAAQQSSDETQTGFLPPGRSPLVLSASSRNRFSVGNGDRTGRFIIQLNFPDSEIPDQHLEVTTNMTVSALLRRLAEIMGGTVSILLPLYGTGSIIKA
jgi:hypothetical protein